MLILVTLAGSVVTALLTALSAARAYLFAWYLWRRTGDITVLQKVAEFDRALRAGQAGQRPGERADEQADDEKPG